MDYAVVGLGFGDEGKGSIVDWLCATKPIDVVVRIGGHQAAHNVVTPDGRHHTFAQFGSGTLQGARTHLSKFMMVEPWALLEEAKTLEKSGVERPLDGLTIDPRALITTPYHIQVGRAREIQRGASRHGSCGVGIGATSEHLRDHPEDALRFGDLYMYPDAQKKLRRIREWMLEECWGLEDEPEQYTFDQVVEGMRASFERIRGDLEDEKVAGAKVYEHSQGILLDELFGFYPYTTWVPTTLRHVRDLDYLGDVYNIGVARSYMTRHGPGPMPTEASFVDHLVTREAHNKDGEWMGGFRAGYFDAVAHRYAIHMAGDEIHGLALTHMDLRYNSRICSSYIVDSKFVTSIDVPEGEELDKIWQVQRTDRLMRAQPGLVYPPIAEDWGQAVAEELGVPVVVESHGPSHIDKQALEVV